MNEAQRLVKEFHQAVELAGPESPVESLEEGIYPAQLRERLLWEEIEELCEALANNDMLEFIKEGCDIEYVLQGAFVSAGIDLEEFFREVHASNMTKVGGEIRADGKRLKPAHYRHADIRSVFERVYGPEHPWLQPHKVLTNKIYTNKRVKLEAVLKTLREHGFSIEDSIKITQEVSGLSYGESKKAVHNSETWANLRTPNETVVTPRKSHKKEEVALD
jgi:predicted HAD superfamily Cof-like phosphohydrolase